MSLRAAFQEYCRGLLKERVWSLQLEDVPLLTILQLSWSRQACTKMAKRSQHMLIAISGSKAVQLTIARLLEQSKVLCSNT